MARHAWNLLGLPELLDSLGFNTAQAQAAAALVINRLVDPVSEHALPAVVARSSLPELLPGVERSTKDRYYRVGDKLLGHQQAIERRLTAREQQVFGLDRTVLLYDMTNTHFEGTAARNPKAERGKNKQKRNDCPQVTIGIVFDTCGFVLCHKVFEGALYEAHSVVDMVTLLRRMADPDVSERDLERPTRRRTMVVMDSGLATRQTIAMLRRKGWSYLVNDSRRSRKQYAEQFAQTDAFEELSVGRGKATVRVRHIRDPNPSSIDDKDGDSGDKDSDSGDKDSDGKVRDGDSEADSKDGGDSNGDGKDGGDGDGKDGGDSDSGGDGKDGGDSDGGDSDSDGDGKAGDSDGKDGGGGDGDDKDGDSDGDGKDGGDGDSGGDGKAHGDGRDGGKNGDGKVRDGGERPMLRG